MPMKGLRRNDDAMKNKCWYQKNKHNLRNNLLHVLPLWGR